MYTINTDFFGFDKKYSKFLKKNKAIIERLNNNLIEILEKIKTTPRDTSFRKTHPLNGKMKGLWSVRVDYENALVLIYEIDDESNVIYLKDVGSHTLYESSYERWLREATRGTYAGFRLDEESNTKIIELCEKLNLETPIEKDDIHITLLYSRKYLPEYEAPSEMVPQKINARRFELFGDTLVLLVNSSFCKKRHEELMLTHKATFDYPEYQPHITLGYSVSKLPRTLDEALELNIVEEYKEELNLDWQDRYKENE